MRHGFSLKISLLARFSLVSLAVTGVIALALAWGIQRQLEESALDQEAESAAEQVTSILNPNLRLADLSGPLDSPRFSQLDALVRRELLRRHIVRVKIWNRDGLLLYSDDQSLVGQHFPLHGGLEEALGGKLAKEISALEKEENVAERARATRLLEIYVPLQPADSPRVAGAYEIYHDLVLLEPRIAEMRRFVWGSLGLGFLLLYGSLFGLVRNASRELVRRSEENARLYQETRQRLAEQRLAESSLRGALAELQQRNAEVSSLLEGARAILERREFEPTARSIFEACTRLVGSTAGYVDLLAADGPGNRVLFLDPNGRSCSLDPTLPMPLRGLREEAHLSHGATYCNDFSNSKWAASIPTGHVRIDSVLFAPLAIRGETLGILGLANKPGGFTENDLRVVSGFADLAAVALHNSRTQEQLLRAQRLEMAGRIAAQVAHDFNNLLVPMMAYPDLIKARLPEDHPTVPICDALQEAAGQMAAINEDLLTLGRRAHATREPMDLNRVVRQAVAAVPGMTDTLTIRLELAADLLPVSGSPAQMLRVATNLVNNARDAVDGNGILTLRTENRHLDQPSGLYNRVEPGEYIKLSVADTGHGIPPEIQGRIFDAFFTTKRADRRRGSGLGLSIVQAIVQDHGGHIDLESEVGKGTTFTVYLPVHRDL